MEQDLFYKRDLSPMLLEEATPFDSKDYIYELKLDGIRCLVYLENNKTTLINKRGKDVTNIYPELSNIHKLCKKKCILDGEIVLIDEGKPNFYELQRRSLLTDKLKIEYYAKNKPINFSAFDILYYDGFDLTKKSLLERKQILLEKIKISPRLSISRYIENEGTAFFNLTKEKGLEGIVAKEKSSKYFFNTRAKSWLKIKNYIEEDLIICGYTIVDDMPKDVVLGYYDTNGILIFRNIVYKGINRFENKILINAKKGKKLFDIPNVKWILPTIVCCVRYMEKTKNNGMRQPVFKGIRDDKLAKDCILSI